MTWMSIIALAALSYLFKALGLIVIGGRDLRGPVADAMRLLPAALLSGLVVSGTVTTDQSVVIDARLIGMTIAAVGVWRKWPFTVIVVLAAAATAAARAI